jgi:hypothetical protein
MNRTFLAAFLTSLLTLNAWAQSTQPPTPVPQAPVTQPNAKKKSRKGLWITLAIVGGVAAVAGTLAYKRFHNEGAI